MHVGLIGAGMMGHGMAANLLQAWPPGDASSRTATARPVEDLVAKGAREATLAGGDRARPR